MDTKRGLFLSVMEHCKPHDNKESKAQNDGGGKMRKWIFTTMLMAACLMLGGCGSGNDSTATDSSYMESYDTEGDSLETEDDVYSSDEEYATDEETEVEDETETEPAEAKGIIAMVQEFDRNGAVATTQVIAIDPENGQQSIISEFTLRCPTTTEIQSDEPIDNSELRFFFPEFNAELRPSGNHHEWFSEDFTKMIATRVFLDRGNEQHAGWIDSEGNFFDVTEAIGAVTESSFSNPDPVKQVATGFENGNFIFCNDKVMDEHVCYSVPVANVAKDAVSTLSSRYGEYENLYSSDGIAYPTYWLNEQECFADLYGHNSDIPNSVKANIGTGELTEYLPDVERSTWSGVLNPEGDTLVFLSTAQRSNGVVELYTMPSAGGEPEKIQLAPNDGLVLDTRSITQKDLYGSPGQRDYVDRFFCLLEWR